MTVDLPAAPPRRRKAKSQSPPLSDRLANDVPPCSQSATNQPAGVSEGFQASSETTLSSKESMGTPG